MIAIIVFYAVGLLMTMIINITENDSRLYYEEKKRYRDIFKVSFLWPYYATRHVIRNW